MGWGWGGVLVGWGVVLLRWGGLLVRRVGEGGVGVGWFIWLPQGTDRTAHRL